MYLAHTREREEGPRPHAQETSNYSSLSPPRSRHLIQLLQGRRVREVYRHRVLGRELHLQLVRLLGHRQHKGLLELVLVDPDGGRERHLDAVAVPEAVQAALLVARLQHLRTLIDPVPGELDKRLDGLGAAGGDGREVHQHRLRRAPGPVLDDGAGQVRQGEVGLLAIKRPDDHVCHGDVLDEAVEAVYAHEVANEERLVHPQLD
mmetsp:Transcript_6861/g.10570  ORF Transcript_6861/g.10570 Transcript_6861/m.10570 type:complete len:205 (+) Transcript_6861:21-635(+)